MSTDLRTRILKASIKHWNKQFSGIDGLALSRELDVPHDEIVSAIEDMVSKGAGHINANVTLHSIILAASEGNLAAEFETVPVTTHVFFPSPAVLDYHYFNSDLVKQSLPEYEVRLHKGENQLSLVYFSEDVLERYQKRPEYFNLHDSQAGGTILTKDSGKDADYMYVQYGKRKLSNGRTAITAILKDMADMADEQQRYWHSFEMTEPEFTSEDPEFRTFLGCTYEGEWGESISPLKELEKALKAVNDSASCILFKKSYNPHLHPPVAGTEKSFIDSCSELFKLLGPDNLDKKQLHNFMLQELKFDKSDFVHSESGREKSQLQLLYMIDCQLSGDGKLKDTVEKVKGYRVAADHKVLEPKECGFDATSTFAELVLEAASVLQRLSSFIGKIKGDRR